MLEEILILQEKLPNEAAKYRQWRASFLVLVVAEEGGQSYIASFPTFL